MLRLSARPRVLVLASVLAATALAAAGMLSGPRKLHPADVPARPALRPDPPAPRSAHSSLVGRLSVAQLAGQRIVYAYSGLTPPRSLLARIRAGEAAGVIFFGPNISSLAQIRSVIHELQAANASSPVHEPLLMLTDQEGGLVRRLPGAPLLSQRQIGESPNPVAGAAQAGAGAGAVLAGVGIDVNLAPVLDVYRRPGDFIDEFQRSYGMDPRMVARLGGAFISAQQRAGVAATAKHFPGLGAAEVGQDTDERPVTLDLSLHEIRAVDEAPYRTAMAAGVKLVMVSWAIYPALDPSLPAGLSARVIQGELRGRLGFGGVTITDGIGAGALRGFGTPAERGVLAAEAGADLLLCSAPDVDEDSPAEGISVLHGLAAAIAAGRVKRGSAERAVQRVLALRLGR